jgi:phosphatidylglycerol---prolipoprotein diacylglyceryl transferase
MDPVLFKLGMFEIRYYGLVYVLGFLLIYYILNKNRDKLNFSKKTLENYIFYLILSVVFFARIFHFFGDLSFYFDNPLEVFKFWNGGMSFFGGLFGTILFSYYFCRKNDIDFYRLAEVIVVPILFILGLGRLANFANGELLGTFSNNIFSINGRHPYVLYSAVKRFFLFGVFFYLSKKNFKKGFLFWLFIFSISLGRFFLSFFRDNPRIFYLTGWQYLSLGLVVISLTVLIKKYWK